MKKIIYTFVFLLICNSVFADTIYLKNGDTVEGRIVKSGEEDVKMEVRGVEITYYTDEIDGIEKGDDSVLSGVQEEHINGMQSPDEVYRAYVDALHEGDIDGLLFYIVKDNWPPPEEKEKMKDMLSFIKGMKPKEYNVIEETIDGNEATLVMDGNTAMGPSRGTVYFVKENGAWKIKEEEWASRTAQNIMDRRQARESGVVDQQYGSISGTINMPQGVSTKGNLYLKLTVFGDQTLLMGVNDSIIFEDSFLDSDKISYSFDELPLGEYFVVAVWDLAEPFCNNKACPGFKGDYTGGSQVVKIENPGDKVSADIMFMNFLQ